MTVRLAAPGLFAAEAARVRRVLEEAGVDAEIVGPEADAQLRLCWAEGRIHRAPPVSEGAVLSLVEPRDALVGASGTTSMEALPAGSRIGFEGPLRRELLGVHRPDAVAVEIGSAEEALVGLEEDRIDGWIASVRVIRDAGAADRILEILEPTSWMAAPGCGTLFVQGVPDAAWSGVVEALDEPAARQALLAEAAVVDALGAGPGDAVAVTARPHGPLLRVRALVAASSGRRLVRAEVSGRLDDAEEVGRRVARQLVARGALQLMAADPGVAS